MTSWSRSGDTWRQKDGVKLPHEICLPGSTLRFFNLLASTAHAVRPAHQAGCHPRYAILHICPQLTHEP